MRRPLILLALLCVGGVAGAKEPPAGRPAFDLALMPRGVGPGVVALRPAELAAAAGTTDDTLGAVVTQSLKAAAAFFDGEVKAGDLPAASAVEQVVLNLGPVLTLNGEEGKSSVNFSTEKLSGYVRTADKFDWAVVVKRWFPKAAARKHGDAEYLSVPLKVGSWEGAMGVYLPDDRTLVFDFDTAVIEKLIDRRAKKEAVEAPPGWDEVKGCSAAYLLPMGDRKWMTAGKDLGEDSQALVELLNATEVACVGLTVGKETAAVAVFTATSDANAKTVEKGVEKGLAALGEGATERFGGEAKADTKRTGKTVRVDATVKGNALKHLVEQMAAAGK